MRLLPARAAIRLRGVGHRIDVGGVLGAEPGFAIDNAITQFDPADPDADASTSASPAGPATPPAGTRAARATGAAAAPAAGPCATAAARASAPTRTGGGRAAGCPVVSRRFRVDQTGERCGAENAFVMERPSDGGLYRAGRGLSSTASSTPATASCARTRLRPRGVALPRAARDLARGARLGPAAGELTRRPSVPTWRSTWSRASTARPTIDWRTKGLSTELDRQLFHHLRTQADAVMVGAGTARAERYGRMAKTESCATSASARASHATRWPCS